MQIICILILIGFSLMYWFTCVNSVNSVDLDSYLNRTQYIIDTIKTLENGDVQEMAKHLKYLVYRAPGDVVIINATSPEKILELHFFDLSKKTVIAAGGILSMNSSHVIDAYNIAAAPYFTSKNFNFIWLYHSYYCTFALSPTCTNLIGQVFAPGIDKLISLGLPAENLEFLGHSAGAHIVASTIEYMITPVKILIGLDPSRNLADFRRGLAEFTIALRSDSTYIGNINWNADLELILNGGVRPQPECPKTEEFDLISTCSHRFVQIVWRSIVENQGQKLFYGVRCNEIECDYSDIKEITPALRKKGTYYFKTSDSYPYGLGLHGIKNITPTKNSTFRVSREPTAKKFMKEHLEDYNKMHVTFFSD